MEAKFANLSSTTAQNSASKLIIFLHWVGSSAPAYRALARALEPHGFTAIGINLPGRAGSSKFLKDSLKNVDDVADWIVSYLIENFNTLNVRDLPIYLFGHSFGGLLSYEVIRRIQNKIPSDAIYQKILPKSLIISSVQSPLALTLKNSDKSISKNYDLSDTALVQYIKDIDGLPENLPVEFLMRALGTIKSDYEIFENYSFNSSVDASSATPHVLSIPVLVLAARHDKTVTLSSTYSWSMYSSCKCHSQIPHHDLLPFLIPHNNNSTAPPLVCSCNKFSHQIIEGNHFYLVDKAGMDSLVSIISNFFV